MMALIEILLFTFGLILLVKGSNFFVKSAASIAKKLGISEFVIGLTLVALGTSIPELASAITASIKQESGLIIGNVVGANIANIALITGLAATTLVIKIKKEMLIRDGYMMIFSAAIFYIIIFNGTISKIESILLLFLYIIYVLFLYEASSNLKGKYNFKKFIDYFFNFKYLVTLKSGLVSGIKVNHKSIKITDTKAIMQLFREGLIKDLLIMAIASFAIFFGVRYFVDGALFFANLLNVPETIIGVSIVSIGTTLPELSVTLSAARKGYGNIALGNIIGSTITNILLILGIAAFIHPLAIINFTIYYAAPFMIFMSILLLLFLRSGWKINRLEGIILLLLYIIFISSLFFTNILF
jgi:cation:H+ antiporter